MLDKSKIGYALKPHTIEVEKGRLRFFAKATGQEDPLYFDEAVARAAGYRSLPVPPTFLFCLEMDAPDPWELHSVLKLDIARLLHGEQSFTYHETACAGDILTFEQRIADVYDRSGGELEFAVKETRVTNSLGVHVADMRNVIVQRSQARMK